MFQKEKNRSCIQPNNNKRNNLRCDKNTIDFFLDVRTLRNVLEIVCII
jgi:hypothetical protein